MKTGAIVENLLGRGWELSWALKNGQDLDKFTGKQKALGLEDLNQVNKTGHVVCLGYNEETVLIIKEEAS